MVALPSPPSTQTDKSLKFLKKILFFFYLFTIDHFYVIQHKDVKMQMQPYVAAKKTFFMFTVCYNRFDTYSLYMAGNYQARDKKMRNHLEGMVCTAVGKAFRLTAKRGNNPIHPQCSGAFAHHATLYAAHQTVLVENRPFF